MFKKEFFIVLPYLGNFLNCKFGHTLGAGDFSSTVSGFGYTCTLITRESHLHLLLKVLTKFNDWNRYSDLAPFGLSVMTDIIPHPHPPKKRTSFATQAINNDWSLLSNTTEVIVNLELV